MAVIEDWIREQQEKLEKMSENELLPGSTPLLRAMRSGETNCELLAQPFRPAAEHADRDDVVALAMRMTFGKPLITNVYRSIIVEAIVTIALDEDWTWCSADWASCDFVHADGTRLEVKQSAARQSWGGDCVARPAFDIAPRTGRYEGATWCDGTGRNADLYLFAYHPLTGAEADHRNPDQWRFYLVAAAALPANKSIGLKAVERLAGAVTFAQLAKTVDDARKRLASNRGDGTEA